MKSAFFLKRYRGSRALFEAIGAALVAVFLAAMTCSLPAQAQDDSSQQGAASPNDAKTKVTPTLRYEVGEKFTKAQMCLDEDDIECAQQQLDDVAKMKDLNTYEQGQLWNIRAYMAYNADDTAAAIDAYEHIRALNKDELPAGLVQASIRNLAVLYLSDENYEKGLEVYLEFMNLPEVMPTEDDYYLLAQIYYSMNRYADGVPPVEKAIEMAKAKGELGDESWYVLLYYFQYQLERRDEGLKTLTTLVQNWTKRQHVMTLAGELSEQERQGDTLTLYEAMYDLGWLKKSSDLVALANLYVNKEAPFKAAEVLDKGLKDGTIDSTEQNWRLLALAWQRAKNDDKALPALEEASKLAKDGEDDRLLAQSQARLANWKDCVESARKALDRGVDREDSVNMQLGQCLVNLRRYPEARDAFTAASKDDKNKAAARSWLKFVNDEMERERRNAELLAQVKEQGI